MSAPVAIGLGVLVGFVMPLALFLWLAWIAPEIDEAPPAANVIPLRRRRADASEREIA